MKTVIIVESYTTVIISLDVLLYIKNANISGHVSVI